MKPAPMTVDRLPKWIREQERRMCALEANMQALTNLLALSRFAVRLPADAERDQRLRLPARWMPRPRPAHADSLPLFPRRRPKAEGHL